MKTKNLFLLFATLFALGIYSCGPSAEENARKQEAAQAEADKIMQDIEKDMGGGSAPDSTTKQ